MLTLSYLQASLVLAAKSAGQEKAVISPDLGMSTTEVRLTAEGIELMDGHVLAWAALEEINENKTACYQIEPGQVRKIQFFSKSLNRVYSLMPTESAPTMLVSGIPMHRIKGIDPYEDTLRKISTLTPVKGRVLDTATGLGYTAIEAAKTAGFVDTIELDPTVLQLCQLNPWSQDLFDNPLIKQHLGDAYDLIMDFADETFSRVIHDPPTIALAGHLYSTEFYRQLHRTLKRNGRLFHYVGDPNSRSGRSTIRGVVHRLKEAGFQRVDRRAEAFGLVGYK